MLTQNGTSHNGSNGVHAQALYPACPSDYEPVTIDVTPTAPKPAWRDQFPAFTHNPSWVDADGCSHSMTLRSDSLSDLMGDLKLLKACIRAAKQKAAEKAPQSTQETYVPDADVPACKVHGTPMIRKVSKRTQGIYFSHKMANGELCFGRAPKA